MSAGILSLYSNARLVIFCRFEDISQIKIPREELFQLTAEHVTYKVYTSKVRI